MFYEFNQNNTGGNFVEDPHRGISHFVIVEADSVEDACDKAEYIGIYFNGCDDGHDCSCCGDRWYRPWEGTETPTIYGQEEPAGVFMKWMKGPEAYVHFKDGTFREFDTVLKEFR